jgi:hypothetical protein
LSTASFSFDARVIQKTLTISGRFDRIPGCLSATQGIAMIPRAPVLIPALS